VSVDLRVAHTIAAPPDVVWPVLVDWAGQTRWIPFTTVRVVSDHQQGLGVRCEALSGFWLGRVPVGLLDRFTVTAWREPSETGDGVLEVLHTGPCFRGPGTFELTPTAGGGTRVSCTEIFDVVGGALPTRLAALLLPVMRAGFASSLRALGKVSLAGR
jgi:uncharacterized protein YndB with AHSA1/START domain